MDNVGILAFIHDYDPENKAKCEVANSAAITSSEFDGYVSGITTVNATESSKEQVYDITGMCRSNIKKGINIVVRDGKTFKIAK